MNLSTIYQLGNLVAGGTVTAGGAAALAAVVNNGVANPDTSTVIGIFTIGSGAIGLLWRTWRAEMKAAQEREQKLRDQITDDKNAEIERLRAELAKRNEG